MKRHFYTIEYSIEVDLTDSDLAGYHPESFEALEIAKKIAAESLLDLGMYSAAYSYTTSL